MADPLVKFLKSESTKHSQSNKKVVLDAKTFVTIVKVIDSLSTKVETLEEKVEDLEENGGGGQPPDTQNLLLWSNTLNNYSSWEEFGGAISRTQENDGYWTLGMPSGASFYQIATVTPSTEYTFSVELKSVPAETELSLETIGGSVMISRNISSEVNGSTYQRISISVTTQVGQTQLVLAIYCPSTGGNIVGGKAQLTTEDEEYIQTYGIVEN